MSYILVENYYIDLSIALNFSILKRDPGILQNAYFDLPEKEREDIFKKWSEGLNRHDKLYLTKVLERME